MAKVAPLLHPKQPLLQAVSNQTILSPEWGYFSRAAEIMEVAQIRRENQDLIHRNLNAGNFNQSFWNAKSRFDLIYEIDSKDVKRIVFSQEIKW